jgi:hypothetical protein
MSLLFRTDGRTEGWTVTPVRPSRPILGLDFGLIARAYCAVVVAGFFDNQDAGDADRSGPPGTASDACTRIDQNRTDLDIRAIEEGVRLLAEVTDTVKSRAARNGEEFGAAECQVLSGRFNFSLAEINRRMSRDGRTGETHRAVTRE